MKSKAPLGIKIISMLYFVSAALVLLSGIYLLFAGASLAQIPIIGVVFAALGYALIIFLLGIATLNFFIGLGLSKGKKWAKVFVIIFSVLGVLIGLGGIFTGNIPSIISVLVSGFIGWYLLFQKESKEFFK